MMKTTSSLQICNFVLGAALSIGLSFVSPIVAADRDIPVFKTFIISADGKSVTPVGPVGAYNVRGSDINDSGQVVGNISNREGDAAYHRAFITGPNGVGTTYLGTVGGNSSYAAGINDRGQVVGYSSMTEGTTHAFITGPNGVGMSDLGTLGGRNSSAADINNRGQVVGESSTTGNLSHAFITGPNGVGMSDLGTLGGTRSSATGINDHGQVAGYSATPGNRIYHAFLMDPNGYGLTDIHGIGYNSDASAINERGQVVGGVQPPGDDGVPVEELPFHAFIDGPNMGMTDLGTLGGDSSDASDINDRGQVVGTSFPTGDMYSHAFITGPNGEGMTDLNSLLAPFVPEPDYGSRGIAINDMGQVLVIAAVPEPTSYALMLAGLALVGFTVRRRSREHGDMVLNQGKKVRPYATTSHAAWRHSRAC